MNDLEAGSAEQPEATFCWQLQPAQKHSYLMPQLQQAQTQHIFYEFAVVTSLPSEAEETTMLKRKCTTVRVC